MNATVLDRDRYRRWAEDQLGIDADAEQPSARASFMKRLDSADFTPPESWVQAIAVMDESIGIPRKAVEELHHEIEKSQFRELRAAVEDFAGRYWELAPQLRRAEWLRLRASCRENPRLLARLDRLMAGLDSSGDLTAFEDWSAAGGRGDMVEKLATQMVEWYPLAPAVRAARRRDWLAGIPLDDLWKSAAEHLEQHHPDVAKLDLELIALLSTSPKRIRQSAAARRTREKIARSAPQPSSISTQTDNQKGGWSIAWVAIMVCVFLVRACASSHSSRSTATVPEYKYNYSKDYPKLFNHDGSPKTIERPLPGAEEDGFATWRLLGGKYKDEVRKQRAIPKFPGGS